MARMRCILDRALDHFRYCKRSVETDADQTGVGTAAIQGGMPGQTNGSKAVMHLKFYEHLERIRPLMALQMRRGCRTKDGAAGYVPTNFGTEVNGQRRHEVETHR